MDFYEVHVVPRRGHQGEQVFVFEANKHEAELLRDWLRDLKKARIVGRFTFSKFKFPGHHDLARFLKYIDNRP